MSDDIMSDDLLYDDLSRKLESKVDNKLISNLKEEVWKMDSKKAR